MLRCKARETGDPSEGWGVQAQRGQTGDPQTGDPPEGWGVQAQRGQTGDPSEGWGVRAQRGQTGDPSEGWGVQAQRGQTGDPSEGWGVRASRGQKEPFMETRYKNPDNDPRGVWMSSDLSVKTYSPATDYPITTPSGKTIKPSESRCWSVSKERLQELIADNRIWFGKNGDGVPRLKKFLSEVKEGVTSMTIWLHSEVGHNQDAKKEVKAFNSEDVFTTPKPERLLERILILATNPGDLVLDSFLGSGTTAAVAHKMGRRWIGIELGEHCHTHCIPRLRKVIDGEDPGGITKAVGWKGGGGFRYYRLGPSLIVKDEWGNPIINPEFNAAMLAEAMCKLEGFRYAPSEDIYWIHGKSTETDFIYVTTQFMSKQMLARLSDEVGSERSLLICCSAFRCDPSQFPNLTIKKIPKAVLQKCEWGHDDYSLEVKNLPAAPPTLEQEEPDDRPANSRRKSGKGKPRQASLFDMGGDQ
ncbi:MAG: site-specific DNA-methyltransferase [Deltaproteobacteria bacterium]|nr:site-specific DNA-methyltransferase [Deltaproteobacteria bacterium]